MESDSSNVLKRSELNRMMEMVAQKLRQMGGTVELVDVGEQEVSAMPHLTAFHKRCSSEIGGLSICSLLQYAQISPRG